MGDAGAAAAGSDVRRLGAGDREAARATFAVMDEVFEHTATQPLSDAALGGRGSPVVLFEIDAAPEGGTR